MRFFASALFAAFVAAVPDGFEEVQILQGVPYMTDMVFAPDAKHMFVSLKEGYVHVYEDQDGNFDFKNEEVALDISDITCEDRERGLGGIQIHPKFEENRWVYLYYTFKKHGNCNEESDNGPVNRFSRFTMNQDFTIDRSSEKVFFDTPALPKHYHNGGRIEFGKDGYLYVTSGDGGDEDRAQETSDLLGAMIRLTDEGDIPPSNPFYGQPDAVRCNEDGESGSGDAKCLELYAVGLRNPFRFSMDPNAANTRFFVNDVGGSHWEEMSEGGDDFVGTQYRLGLQNFGWPVLEGPCKWNKFEGCRDASYDGDFVPPYHFYRHQDGGAATASAIIPNGIWPTGYDNAYLHGDFVFGKIFLVKDSVKDHCYSCNPPESGKDVSTFTNIESVVSMRFGPYKDCKQALYITSLSNGGIMKRVTYVGDDISSTCPPATSPTIMPPPGTDTPEVSTPKPTVAPTSAPTPPPLATEGGYPGDMFPWASGDACPEDFDYCGMLEFCTDNNPETYGYRLPCLEEDCPCPGNSGPLIRLQPGNRYRLTLRNAAPDDSVITNLHTHGLHIVGDGDGDDVIREVAGGGNCLDYTWDVATDHPGGTYWYHAHHHGHTQEQVEGGAFGLLIVEDNKDINPNLPAWAANERLLQVVFSTINWNVFGNGKTNEVIDMDANQWYRLRVSLVDSDAVPRNFTFDDQGDCTIHKVANDGIWRSVVPGLSGTWSSNVWELTGASRADFAVNCATPNSLVPVYFGDLPAATLRIGSFEPNPYVMEEWIPERPYAFRDLRTLELPDGNSFSVRLGYDYVNDVQWDPDVPIATIGFDQVQEWTLLQTINHPFHIHLYHMQVVTPGGCGAHEEGEWYDTISAPGNCTVRFNTADIGQRCVLHCHVLFHEDNGSMSWVNVAGPNMPRNDVQSFQYQCPASNYQNTPATPTQCVPGFLGVDSNGTVLVPGNPYVNEEFGVFSYQQRDGNLVVIKGTPDADPLGDTIWVSSETDGSGEYFTTVQGDGHLITWTGTPDNKGSIHWKSDYSGEEDDYFLGIDCNSEFVSVYKGSPNEPGPAVWNSVPTPPPSPMPTRTPTVPPTNMDLFNLPTSGPVPSSTQNTSSASRFCLSLLCIFLSCCFLLCWEL